jgi:hypothetical protein
LPHRQHKEALLVASKEAGLEVKYTKEIGFDSSPSDWRIKSQ